MNVEPISVSPQPRANPRERLISVGYIAAAFALGCLTTWATLLPRSLSAPTPFPDIVATARAASAYANQSLRLIDEKRYSEAIETCERGLSIKRDDPVLLNNLATAYLLDGKIGRGEAILTKLAADAPSALVRSNLAWAKSLRDDAEKRISDSQAILASSPATAAKINALWTMA